MALVDNAWYVNYGNGSTTGYYAATKWATGATIAAGALRRQNATPATGNERMFVAVVGGTTHATTEPTWGVTRGAKTTDNTVTWQECTGVAALNGDATNTPNWTTVKNTAVTLGQVIKRNNGASYQICTTAGTAGNGSEPSFSDTAGTTTADNTVTWTSLGVVGNFASWGAPHARVGSALTTNWAQAGNKVYVGDNSAETQNTSITLAPGGTKTSPASVICVDHAGSVPPVSADLKTTATVTITGTANLTFSGGGGTLFQGITFNVGTGAGQSLILIGNADGTSLRFVNCSLRLVTTSTVAFIAISAGAFSGEFIDFDNTTVSFGDASQAFDMWPGTFRWRNTASALLGTIPTKLFTWTAGRGSTVEIVGVDLSAAGSGKTLVDNASSGANRISFSDCKLNASVTKTAVPTGIGGLDVSFYRCDSSGTNYAFHINRYAGTIDHETTIVRTGGASDGTTSLAWKMVTSANSNVAFPLESLPIAIWNDTVGSAITETIYGIWGGGAVPNNDDIWIEAEYLGSSSSPLASFANSAPADILAANAALSSDGSSWGGSTTPFKIAVTFTPQQKGIVLLRVKAAKASSTFYIDPKVNPS